MAQRDSANTTGGKQQYENDLKNVNGKITLLC